MRHRIPASMPRDQWGDPVVSYADVYEPPPTEGELAAQRRERAERQARRDAGEYVPTGMATFQAMTVTEPLLRAGWVTTATPVREDVEVAPEVDPRFARPFTQVQVVYRVEPRTLSEPWASGKDPKPWDPDAAAEALAALPPVSKSGSATRREAQVKDGVLWVKCSWVTTMRHA